MKTCRLSFLLRPYFLSLAIIAGMMGGVGLAKERPNVVVFLADDFGVGCVNVNGADDSLVRTPHINRLAEEGLNFTNAYTTGSVCSPTRYGLLTGRYSWRTKLKSGVVNSMDGLSIDLDRLTLASYLQDLGYQTAQVGKWHLGYGEGRHKGHFGKLTPGANAIGFDYHFGVPNNQDDLHKIYIENDRIYGLRSDRISPYGKSFYGKPYIGYDAPQRVTTEVMDTLTEKTLKWLGELDRDAPFFLYFASTAVHHPISPSERMRGSSEAGAYGDFIHDTDYAVGQIMGALKARGLAENTIFIFTGDNGSDIPPDEKRPEAQAVTRGLAVNGENRGDKHMIYNGGFRVPYIVHWPRGIREGGSRSGLVSTVDIFATVADLVDGEAPAPELGAPDSFSYKASIEGGNLDTERTHLVLRDAAGQKAVLFGDWKYISDELPESSSFYGKKKLKEELYYLANDPGESNNLAEKNPEVLARGRKLLQAIIENPESRKFDALP